MRAAAIVVMLTASTASADPSAYLAAGGEAAIANYGQTIAGTVEAGLPINGYEIMVLAGGGRAFKDGASGSYVEVELGGDLTKCTQSGIVCFVGKLAFAYRGVLGKDHAMFDYAAGIELGGKGPRFRLVVSGGLGDLRAASNDFVVNGSLQLAVAKRF